MQDTIANIAAQFVGNPQIDRSTAHECGEFLLHGDDRESGCGTWLKFPHGLRVMPQTFFWLALALGLLVK